MFEPGEHTQLYKYNFDDEVSEEKRTSENQAVLNELEKRIKLMQIDSDNGLKEQPFQIQCQILENNEREAFALLRTGTFKPREFKKLISQTRQRIRNIYSPNMKDYEARMSLK